MSPNDLLATSVNINYSAAISPSLEAAGVSFGVCKGKWHKDDWICVSLDGIAPGLVLHLVMNIRGYSDW